VADRAVAHSEYCPTQRLLRHARTSALGREFLAESAEPPYADPQYGGVGGEDGRPFPLSRLFVLCGRDFRFEV
jgi:hypothetical protein